MKIGIVLAVAVLLWTPAGCKRRRSAALNSKGIATVVQMGDPRAADQLTSGFYDIDENAWRWTRKQFAVEIGTPLGANTRGATLEVALTVPPVIIERNGSVTLSANIEGTQLQPETYSKAGDFVYRRDVPPDLLGPAAVKGTFEVDKTFTPGGPDQRVLGIVVTTVALVRK